MNNLPNTKAQQDIALICSVALSTVLEGCFTGNLDEANVARDTLERALELAFQISYLQKQVTQIPEENRSLEAQRFVTPVSQDAEDVEILLTELEKVNSIEALQDWYSATKIRRDRVEEQTLRNKLFDAIRIKKEVLCQST